MSQALLYVLLIQWSEQKSLPSYGLFCCGEEASANKQIASTSKAVTNPMAKVL